MNKQGENHFGDVRQAEKIEPLEQHSHSKGSIFWNFFIFPLLIQEREEHIEDRENLPLLFLTRCLQVS
jgi:hypothetical protein